MDDEHRRVGDELSLDIEKKLHLENSQNHGYCLRVTRAVCRESEARAVTDCIFVGIESNQQQTPICRALDGQGRHLLHNLQASGARRGLRR
jgi:hypothetical protein